MTDTSIPRDICRAGKDRLYWSTAEQLRRAVKRDKATLGLVWRGEDKRGRGVWELSTGDPATGPNSVARGAVARRHIANWWAAYRQRQEKYNRTFSSDYLMRESLSPTDGGWMGAPVVRGGGGPGGGGD